MAFRVERLDFVLSHPLPEQGFFFFFLPPHALLRLTGAALSRWFGVGGGFGPARARLAMSLKVLFLGTGSFIERYAKHTLKSNK